jgi:hypothetical protein
MMEAPKPGPHETAATEEDRRRAERYDCDLQPLVREWGSSTGESGMARVCNISRTGIALLTPARVRPGRVLVLKLTGAGGGFARPVLVRVIHSTRQPDGLWLSGGAFVRRLSEEELEVIRDQGLSGETPPPLQEQMVEEDPENASRPHP